MIALLIRCAIALAIFLVVASLPFGVAGRPLRHAGFAVFFGVFALTIVVDMLRVLLPVLLSDWRFYVVWLITSPIAYLILQSRRDERRHGQGGRPTPPKRRDADIAEDRASGDEQRF